MVSARVEVIGTALVGVAFIKVLYGSEDLADRIWRGPDCLRPAIGRFLLGALLLVLRISGARRTGRAERQDRRVGQTE